MTKSRFNADNYLTKKPRKLCGIQDCQEQAVVSEVRNHSCYCLSHFERQIAMYHDQLMRILRAYEAVLDADLAYQNWRMEQHDIYQAKARINQEG